MLCSPRFPLWIQDCFLNESFQSKSFCDKRSEVSMTLILRLLSNNLAESELPDLKSLSHRFECVVHFFFNLFILYSAVLSGALWLCPLESYFL